MVARRPLVNISGLTTELPPGDFIVGGSVGTLTAGSGLDGGGDLSTAVTTNVSLAPNPSGLLFVDGKLGVDGVARVTGAAALASGNFSLSTGTAALASGIAGSSLAATALASGNAALADIAAIPGGTIETFTAASAVASGYAVGLDDGGKVQTIQSVTNFESRSTGSPSVFQASTTGTISSVFYISENKCVIHYRDIGNSSYGTAVVASISGSSVSFGSPVVFASTACTYISATFDSSNNKSVVFYTDSNVLSYGKAVVGTVSGTTISFGSTTTFVSQTVDLLASTFDSANLRCVVSYRNNDNSFYGTAIVGTVSGTSISFGTPVVYESANSSNPSIAFDTSVSKVVIAYKDAFNSNYGTAIVGTVSGTSISFGTAVVFLSNNFVTTSTIYHSTNNKIIISYSDFNNSYRGYSKVGTVSGTSISFGSAAIFSSSDNTTTFKSVYDAFSNRILHFYIDPSNSNYGTVVLGTVSGTSITFGSPVVYFSALTSNADPVYDSVNTKSLVSFANQANSSYGTSVVVGPGVSIYPTISSQNNFIGIAQTTAASGSAVQVRLPGSYDQNNTGLTPGAVYYVNPTTSGFTTTATQPVTWSGAVNWGPVGRAVNSTTLLLTDMI